MKKYLGVIGGAILGVVLVAQVSGDLAFVGLFLGAGIGWMVTGWSDRDAMRDGSDNNAGWVDDTTP